MSIRFKYKVLQLPWWASAEAMRWHPGITAETLGRYVQTEPIFHRPGLYIWGKAAWLELEDGRAFEASYKQTKFELDVLHAAELDEGKVSALRAVVRQRMATKRQKRLLHLVECSQQLRQTQRNATLAVRRVLGRFPE